MKKLIAMLIILTVSAPLLFSCGGEETDGGQGDIDADGFAVMENGNGAAAEPADDLYDNLGEFDFGGAEFVMLTRANPRYHHVLNVEEMVGEPFNDAKYARSRNLEERFNFTFVEHLHTADGGGPRARNSILAGDDVYDIITLHILVTFPMAVEGMLHPASVLPHIDLDRPYWNRQLNEDLAIANRQFFAFGAHNLSTYDFTFMTLFNKQMIEDFGLDCPYELVRSGRWTFDRFEEMSREVTANLDGTGIMRGAYDRFGYVSSIWQIMSNFMVSADARSVGKDANGIPYSNMSNPHFLNVFNRIFEMTWDNNSWYGPHANYLDGSMERIFEEGRALFLDTSFYFVHRLRAMETDFGIIPYPKWNESQVNYYSRLSGASAATVPVTITDPARLERTSVILEGMASESMRRVIPAYYDIALLVRAARDEESAEMLDIVFNNRTMDLGNGLWGDDISAALFMPMIRDNDRDLVSRLEARMPIIQNLFDSAVEALTQLD